MTSRKKKTYLKDLRKTKTHFCLREPQNRTKHVDQSADTKKTLLYIQSAVDV